MNTATKPLHEFIFSNRNELIQRCMGKVAMRPIPANTRANIDHGMPKFLEQLVDELWVEVARPADAGLEPTPSPPEITRASALHGAEMLREGYTIDQVVHDYGDVCQSITELAMERKIPIKTDEFRILNRTLDNAIAGAVTAYSQGKQISIDDRTDSVERLNAFCEDLRRLVNIAIRSYAAVQIGNVGVTGATGKLVAHALDELRSLGERSLPKSAGEFEGNKPASP